MLSALSLNISTLTMGSLDTAAAAGVPYALLIHNATTITNASDGYGGLGNGNYYSHNGSTYTHPLQRFHEVFLSFYGYMSVCICLFGVITNIINISVLMTKEMRTPTNNFLIALAVFDILTMVPYIPFAVHFSCPPVSPDINPEAFSYSWVLFMSIVIQLMATTHTVSIWLAVSLAAFRYSQVRRPCPRGPLNKERRIRLVRIVIFTVTLVSVLVLIPHYMTQSIEQVHIPYGINVSFYRIHDPTMEVDGIDLITHMNILAYGILGKIIPCVLILIFSGHLVFHMSIRNIRRRQRLSAQNQQWKTTNMLLVVLILFICTELPQGIFILLTATIQGFFDDTQYYLGELFDFACLLNNAINFVLYCAMSQQFRDQFMTMYVNKYWILRTNQPLRACNSEVLTMRDGAAKTATTITSTHQNEEMATAKL